MTDHIEPAPADGTYLWEPEATEWTPVLLDAFGFPATPERKEALRVYQNWVWSDEVGNWVPPTPQPDPILSPENWVDAFFVWDDDAVEWVQRSTQPFPSWTRDQSGNWVAPVPYPVEGDWEWDEDTLSWVSPEPSA